jgi:hypothetical protein
MRQLKHWQDVVNALIGAALVLSPWALGFATETALMANAVIVGVALLAVALGAVFVPRAWEEWTQLALGVWAIASPWVLGFAGTHEVAMRTLLVAGVLVVALALWTLLTDKDYRLSWQGSTAH